MTNRLDVRLLLVVGLGFMVAAAALHRPDGVRDPAQPIHAAPDSITEADGQTLASFADARALAVDPRGRLYVAAAGRDVVVMLSAEGTRLQVFGGSGTRSGLFDEPVDVDPTNGLQVLVADAGNGRLQRFSEEGRFLEALPVGRMMERQAVRRSVFEQGQDALDASAPGRPVAVVSTATQAVFAIDVRNRTVLHWASTRQLSAVAGSGDVGAVSLQDPVALALDAERRLYVADAGAGAVWVFDRFGTFVRRLDLPKASSGPVQALAVHEQRLWVVFPRSLIALSLETGRRLRQRPVALNESLVDVAFDGSRLYLLTATRLLRVR